MATGQEPRNIRVFISYLNDDPSRLVAKQLAKDLAEQYGYTVFFDVEKLRPTGGVKWDDKLFDEARTADVLIVLLQPATATSDWVQREVDTARGANVSILPIRVTQNVQIKKALEKLAISNLQFLPFDSLNPDYSAIVGSIESLAQETRRKQKEWWENLKNSRKIKRPDSRDPKRLSFKHPDVDGVQIHIAHGDMTEMGAIDVLVNTENIYMQMARIFESDTLSSRLRYQGSLISDDTDYVHEDTVQKQLDEIIDVSEDLRRPVPTTSVIATHAGHPQSRLYRRVENGKISGSRYIFHVASVDVSHQRDKLIPVSSDDEVRTCVLKALEKVIKVDKAKGLISPLGCKSYEDEKAARRAYKPIESIIFPLFGAGRGGRSATVVIPPMVDGIWRFLRDKGDHHLKDIYLCIYSETDVKAAEQAFLKKKFIPV